MKVTGLSRVSKDLIIGEIKKELEARPMFFVAQHGATPATSLDKLRRRLQPLNARYLVVKNSLGKKALDQAKLPKISDHLEGACGLAFSSGDPVQSSKVLVEFAKENETFKIRTAFMNGELISLEQIKALASLPSKEVLIAMVVGGIQAPLARFVGVLSGTVRKVVTVLDAIAKKKGNG